MKLCPYCKAALARDDARFCQNCGKPTSPHPLSANAPSLAMTHPELLEDTVPVPAIKKSSTNQTSLPEQIARQPEPMARVSEAQPLAPEKQASRSAPLPLPRTFTAPLSRIDQPPAQELPEKIEDQHTAASPTPSMAVQNTPVPAMPPSLDPPSSSASQEVAASDQEPEANDRAEDALDERLSFLPGPDAAAETKSDYAGAANEQVARPVLVQPIPAKFSAFPDAGSRLTSPLPSVVRPVQPIPSRSSVLPAAVQSIPARLSALSSVIRGLPSSQAIPARLSEHSAAIRELAFSAPALLRARQRLSVPLVVSICVALVLVGVGSWLLIDQPFSVSPVTRPQLGFSDAHMGLSLSYPNGWSTKKNASDSTVQFSDSSHTAQVIIAISNRNSTTITASLQKQSAQLGMSGVKSVAPLSFAGASWQGIQGIVQQNGASYTCTIFATIHANHLVMLTQLAPQSVYDQEDSLVFSALRRSLQFV
jgi:hypothetical protein